MNRQIIFLFIILGFVMSSCKKKTETIVEPQVETPVIPVTPKPTKFIGISNEIKEWGNFKVGSYWIMRDSVAASIDSVYVVSVFLTSRLIQTNQDTNILAETIIINFNQNTVIPSFSLTIYGIYNTNNEIMFLENTPETACFSNNFWIPSCEILGNIYKNVKYTCFATFHNAYGHGPSGTIIQKNFWKKKVGIIKHYDNWYQRTYELIRYNIIQ